MKRLIKRGPSIRDSQSGGPENVYRENGGGGGAGIRSGTGEGEGA